MKGGKMTIELTNDEKLTIAEQHLKNILFNEYNAQLSLIEAQAVDTPNQSNIDSINAQLSDITSQKDKLQREINSLTPSSN
jgi:hypothetical protein